MRELVYSTTWNNPDDPDEKYPPRAEPNENESAWDYAMRCAAYRDIQQPDPAKWNEPRKEMQDWLQNYRLEERFGGRLQIVVKIISIELTPERPVFEKRKWYAPGRPVCRLSLF